MAQCYHFEGVNNPLDKDADGGMTHDNILRPDWHKGKDLPVNHTSNMSTQTEFDKELKNVSKLAQIHVLPFLDSQEQDAYQKLWESYELLIKQAVDTYVIGEDEYETGMVGSDYEMTKHGDDNKANQRLALWGDK